MDRSAAFRLMAGPLGLALVAAGLAGCGGGSSSHRTASASTSRAPSSVSSTATSSTATSSTATSSTSPAAASTVTTGPVRAKLVGAGHRPAIGHPWSYTVTAHDPSGHPLSGTVETEFVFGGLVVGRETPPTHRLKRGRLHDVLTFPPAAEGRPLQLQVMVHTSAGTVRLDWPVTPA